MSSLVNTQRRKLSSNLWDFKCVPWSRHFKDALRTFSDVCVFSVGMQEMYCGLKLLFMAKRNLMFDSKLGFCLYKLLFAGSVSQVLFERPSTVVCTHTVLCSSISQHNINRPSHNYVPLSVALHVIRGHLNTKLTALAITTDIQLFPLQAIYFCSSQYNETLLILLTFVWKINMICLYFHMENIGKC